jgi:hypothetical protein
MPSKNSIGKRFVILLLALAAFTVHAQSKEYQIKATFLFNFAQFVEWPTNTFTGTNEPFCIGILGEDPFGDFLDGTVRGEKINGHPLVVHRYRQAEEIQDCQLLFVSHSEAGRFQQILAGLKDKNILTVSDTTGFCKAGGIIRFVTEQNKIHFRINSEAAKNANLAVSSKLLRLAEIVQPGED